MNTTPYRYCGVCGDPLAPGVTVCGNCGAPVEATGGLDAGATGEQPMTGQVVPEPAPDSTMAMPAAAAAGAAGAAAAGGAAGGSGGPGQPGGGGQPPADDGMSNGMRWLIGGLVALAVVLIAVIAVLALSGGSDSSKTTMPRNASGVKG